MRGNSIRMLMIPLVAITAQAAAYLLAYLHAHRSPELIELLALGVATAMTATLVTVATPRRAL